MQHCDIRCDSVRQLDLLFKYSRHVEDLVEIATLDSFENVTIEGYKSKYYYVIPTKECCYLYKYSFTRKKITLDTKFCF